MITRSETILIVEDDTQIRNFISYVLQQEGFPHLSAGTAKNALSLLVTNSVDLVLLDLGLPDYDGMDVIKKIREWSEIPIIVVSARDQDHEKAAALDAGADDYLTKPFSIDEFLARLRVALRRSHTDGGKEKESSVYLNGDLKIDYSAGCVYLQDTEVHLTPIEYKLLCLLAQNTGKVLTHNYILKEVWGNVQASDVPSLRVFMATLRKKIEKSPSSPQYIQTHIGVGYRMIKQKR